MRILIGAIGRAKKGPELDLYHHYLKRLPWTVTLKEHEAKSSLPTPQRILAEGEWLLNSCKGYDRIIALDEKGAELTSEGLARQIATWRDQSLSSMAFVIGGADGLAQPLREQVHLTLSFGRMTWPHMLVRALLTEQLYRAYTILTNHPYHRS